jgi:fatty acid desaturase
VRRPIELRRHTGNIGLRLVLLHLAKTLASRIKFGRSIGDRPTRPHWPFGPTMSMLETAPTPLAHSQATEAPDLTGASAARSETAERKGANQSFSMAEARHIVRDLFTPSAVIYWADFLLSWSVALVCFALVRQFPLFSWQQILLFVASSVLIYRAALFIHEIVHLRTGTFRVFRFVWNMLCGIPFLVPSFLYYTHLDHHRRAHFGTARDGEYIPLGQQSPWAILWYLCQPFFVPGLAIIRFFVLTPLTWFDGPIRRQVYARASSMVMDPTYVRPMPTKAMLRVWRFQELMVFLFCATVAVFLVRGLVLNPPEEAYRRPILNAVLPMSFLVQAYLTGFFIAMINNIRTLGAHRFINDGRELTFVEQLLDSVNYPKFSIIAEMWGPVGLRYHALHHLFPSLPYHNLGRAHQRLMAELPADSPYRLTNSDSLRTSLKRLWKASLTASRERKLMVQGGTP